MKCVKCDKCGKIVDIDPRNSNMSMGSTVPEPFYKYGTLFIANDGDLNINTVNYKFKHLCRTCMDRLHIWLEEKSE